jgi:hypothetical protein
MSGYGFFGLISDELIFQIKLFDPMLLQVRGVGPGDAIA